MLGVTTVLLPVLPDPIIVQSPALVCYSRVTVNLPTVATEEERNAFSQWVIQWRRPPASFNRQIQAPIGASSALIGAYLLDGAYEIRFGALLTSGGQSDYSSAIPFVVRSSGKNCMLVVLGCQPGAIFEYIAPIYFLARMAALLTPVLQ